MVNIVETDLEFGALSERPVTDLIVIHHVGGTDRDVSAAEIHEWHLQNGWSGIGYNFVIRKDGTIERGRPEWAIGSHAYGYNSRSIGINIVGAFEGEIVPTDAQIEAASQLVAELATKYGIDVVPTNVVGHCDLMSTDCPGNNLYSELDTIRGKAIWYQNH